MDKADLRRATEQMIQRLGTPQGCKHPHATRSEDTNEDGMMIIYNCPDCGYTMGVHPDQEKAWAAQLP